MNIELGYGKGKQAANVPDKNILQILTPNKVDLGDAPTGADSVREALANPIGSPRLGEIVRPGEKIAIITSDVSRPMPTWVAMPPLLEELFAAGMDPDDITLVFALGSHRHQTEEERQNRSRVRKGKKLNLSEEQRKAICGVERGAERKAHCARPDPAGY